MILIVLQPGAVPAQEIRDVKPPVDWPGFPWWGIVVGMMVLAAAASLVWLWKRRGIRRPEVPGPQVPPWETAFQRLQALKAKNLAGQGRVKEYFSELSDIIRRYLEQRFVVKAPEMTTEEFLVSLKEKDFLSASQKAALRDFLTCCDLVKFARYGSNEQEMEQSFLLGKKLVEETRGTTGPEN